MVMYNQASHIQMLHTLGKAFANLAKFKIYNFNQQVLPPAPAPHTWRALANHLCLYAQFRVNNSSEGFTKYDIE